MTEIPHWKHVLEADTSLSPSTKEAISKFVGHYLAWAIRQKEKDDLGLFLKEFTDRYHPNEERLKQWNRSALWFLKHRAQLTLPLMRHELRRQNYAWKTEKTYMGWAKRFVEFHHQPERPTAEMVSSFLSHLALTHCSTNTQKGALNALVFLYRCVFRMDLDQKLNFRFAPQGKRVPTVLTPSEFEGIFSQAHGIHRLLFGLLYGSGLRISEAISLRIKDFDLERLTVTVNDSKYNNSRVVMLSKVCVPMVKEQWERSKLYFSQDRQLGKHGVMMPHAMDRKFKGADITWPWFWLFPAHDESKDPRTGIVRRHHVHDSNPGKVLRECCRKLGINKRVTLHTLRHSFATHTLERGKSIHQVQEWLGHADIRTTEIYLHTMRHPSRDTSVLDDLIKT